MYHFLVSLGGKELGLENASIEGKPYLEPNVVKSIFRAFSLLS